MVDDIIFLLHGDGIFAGRLYDDRIAVVRPEPEFLCIGISIDLHEIATSKRAALIVIRRQLRDVHTVLMHLNLIAKLIAALIFAIQQHIDSSAVWGIRHPQALAQLEGQQIAHQGLIAIIIDKRPFLRLCRGIEHMLLLVELDAIGFLGEVA